MVGVLFPPLSSPAVDSAGFFFYKPVIAQVAQSVEQSAENRRVGGSIPPLGTFLGDRPFTLMDIKGIKPPAR